MSSKRLLNFIEEYAPPSLQPTALSDELCMQSEYGNAAVLDLLQDFGICEPDMSVTRNATTQDWEALRREVAAFEAATPDDLLRATSDEQALEDGDILSGTTSRSDGMIEEQTVGMVDLPYAIFAQRVLPAEWGVNLYGYVGGEVEELAHDEQGRPTRQQERMVLETPVSEYASWLGDMLPATRHFDMTKTEEIEYGEDYSRVRWRVYTSDNNTVAQDIGYVHFQGCGGKTKITFHSAHAYTDEYNGPLAHDHLSGIGDAITAKGLRDYFTSAIGKYRDLAGV